MPGRQNTTGKKVAVIGSGPAGLLRLQLGFGKAGHPVAVLFDADRPGGLLMYGIPNMASSTRRLSCRRISCWKTRSVTFVLQHRYRRQLLSPEMKKLRANSTPRSFAPAPLVRRRSSSGRQLKGIHFAMDFLTANTKSILDKHRNGNFISREGKGVIITSAAATPAARMRGHCIRHGCRSSCTEWKSCPNALCHESAPVTSVAWNSPRSTRWTTWPGGNRPQGGDDCVCNATFATVYEKAMPMDERFSASNSTPVRGGMVEGGWGSSFRRYPGTEKVLPRSSSCWP